jgi:hypothetical protein
MPEKLTEERRAAATAMGIAESIRFALSPTACDADVVVYKLTGAITDAMLSFRAAPPADECRHCDGFIHRCDKCGGEGWTECPLAAQEADHA